MLSSYLSADGLRAITTLLFAISQAVMAYWPEIRGWRHTITTRSSALDTLVVPFGPFFAVWLVIFSSCIGFAVWQTLPSNLADSSLASIGWIAALLFAINTLWEYHIPKRGFDWMSAVLIAFELIGAIALVWLLTVQGSNANQGLDFWLGTAPLYFYSGWVTVAAFVSWSSTLVRYDSAIDPRRPKWATVLIGAAVILAMGVCYLSGSWVYAAAVIWGVMGIAVGAFNKQSRRVLILCSSSLVIITGTLFI